MRHVVAALVSGRALASSKHAGDRTPELPDVETAAPTRRRRAPTWAWLLTLWKATHAGR